MKQFGVYATGVHRERGQVEFSWTFKAKDRDEARQKFLDAHPDWVFDEIRVEELPPKS